MNAPNTTEGSIYTPGRMRLVGPSDCVLRDDADGSLYVLQYKRNAVALLEIINGYQATLARASMVPFTAKIELANVKALLAESTNEEQKAKAEKSIAIVESIIKAAPLMDTASAAKPSESKE